MGRAATFAVVCSLALVALPSLAAAQAPGSYGPPGAYQPPPAGPPTGPPPAYVAPDVRRGFVIGFGIGGGSIDAVDDSGSTDESFDGFSFDLHIGGMLSPRFALLGEVWGIVHSDDSSDNFNGGPFTLTHNIFALAAQFWITPQFWLKGGVGRAKYTIETDYDSFESDDVPAFMGGLGYELSHSRTFAVDLQLRFGVADYSDADNGGGELHNGAFVVGFNWY